MNSIVGMAYRTAPKVRPRTKYRCNMRATAEMGSNAITPTAMYWPQAIPMALENPEPCWAVAAHHYSTSNGTNAQTADLREVAAKGSIDLKRPLIAFLVPR